MSQSQSRIYRIQDVINEAQYPRKVRTHLMKSFNYCRTTMYNKMNATIGGNRFSRKEEEQIAALLGIKYKELFTENYKDGIL